MFNSANNFEYEATYRRSSEDGDTIRRKEFRKGRSSYTPNRRSSRGGTEKVAIGIAGRRGRRWAW